VTDGLAALPVEGTVHRAGADGRFDVSGVASGLTAVAVSAPEYSRRQVTGGTPAGDVLDLGTIPLDRRQDLEVVIRHDGLVDPASFALWMRGPDGVRTADADADGRFRFELLSAGSYVFAVRGGGDPASYTESRELAPGDEWRVEVDVSGGVVLNILAIGADGDPVLGGHDIAIDRYLKDGGSGANVNPDANGRARVRVPPGNLQLTLKTRVDAGNVPLATRRLRFDEPGEYDVELRVGEGDRRFRVTDENGDPVAGVRLTCNLGDPFEWCSDGVTDGEGIAVVRGLATAADNARVSLSHAERGIRLSIPVHLGPPTEITAITFEAGVQASFVFTRPGRPAVGARAVLGDTLGLRAIPGPMTDERGRAVFDEIVPGAYRAQILGDDYWPSHRIVTVDGNSTVTVEVFKRCDARVEVTVGGVPASGVAMQLQADDQASPVGKYVADGYVTSSTGSLTTGADGSVVLKGLAEGHYRWSTTAPSGEAVEGVAELDADEENVVRIALPE
jgi:hypothetical protein